MCSWPGSQDGAGPGVTWSLSVGSLVLAQWWRRHCAWLLPHLAAGVPFLEELGKCWGVKMDRQDGFLWAGWAKARWKFAVLKRKIHLQHCNEQWRTHSQWSHAPAGSQQPQEARTKSEALAVPDGKGPAGAWTSHLAWQPSACGRGGCLDPTPCTAAVSVRPRAAWTSHLAQQPSACGWGRCLGTGVSLPGRCPQHCVLSVTVCVVSESRIGLVCVVWCLGYENG